MAASVVNQAATAVQGMVTSPLKQGSQIPSNKLKEDDIASATFDLGDATASGKTIILGVPGAFSSTCSTQVPGYVAQEDKFAEKGVKGIYVVAINDAFVTQAWKKHLQAENSKLVRFLADDTGAWSAAAGMTFEATPFFGNRRSNRYSAVVQDGVVQKIWIEEQVTEVTSTSADNVLQNL